MSQNDPTDHALAAIASILDQPATQSDPIKTKSESKPVNPGAIEAEGYSKIGPGPIGAVRFKWTVRRHNEEYYVDETIGENSRPLVSGPLTKEAAIKLVDERESNAQQRFDSLKREMAGRGAPARK